MPHKLDFTSHWIGYNVDLAFGIAKLGDSGPLFAPKRSITDKTEIGRSVYVKIRHQSRPRVSEIDQCVINWIS